MPDPVRLTVDTITDDQLDALYARLAAAAAAPTVQGRCPACSRTTLILGVGGYVTCSHLECPDPSAASDLLDLPATSPEAQR